MNTFKRFSNNFNKYDVICGQKLEKTNFTFFRGIYRSILGVVWIFQLLLKGTRLIYALWLLPYINMCADMTIETNKININKYCLLVTYSELSPDENFMVRFFNKKKIKTATLQHGVFTAKNNSNDCLRGIQLRESVVDYFLAWNKFTKENAIIEGLNEKKVYVLGIPRFINCDFLNLECKNKTVFGVVLNGFTEEFNQQNIELIKIAEQLSEYMSYKYLLKYHPNMNGDEYSQYTSKNCLDNCANFIDLFDYVKHVNFSLVGSSSMFVELVYLKHNVFRYSSTTDDIYNSIKHNSFKNFDELKIIINKKDKVNNNLFKYLCTTRNIKNNYQKFFEKIVDENLNKKEDEEL